MTAAGQVADTIGVFTSSIQIAQDFFIAGLPCWLIQPSSQFTDQNIFQVVDLLHPQDQLTLGPHPFCYPIIFVGSALLLEKYCNIYQYARNFLCFPDPFGGSTTHQTPPSLSLVPSSCPSGRQPVAGPSSQSLLVCSGAQSQRHHPKRSRMTGGHKTGEVTLISLSLPIAYCHCRSPKQ